MNRTLGIAIIVAAVAAPSIASASEYEQLARQLTNPVAALISVPLQMNYNSGIGPTGVALRQQGPWTVGLLANHIWSFAGESDRDDVSTSFMQPFVSYTTPTACSRAREWSPARGLCAAHPDRDHVQPR